MSNMEATGEIVIRLRPLTLVEEINLFGMDNPENWLMENALTFEWKGGDIAGANPSVFEQVTGELPEVGKRYQIGQFLVEVVGIYGELGDPRHYYVMKRLSP